ncbi:MAG TPA: peptide-binding protein [Gemmatimonadota bacterium]|nr:peptide-binding protein [Gemmatimonadota bacterium]
MARCPFARPLLLVPILLALACGGPGEPAGDQPDTQEAPVDGGTAVVAETADFDAFNELVSTDYDTNQVMSFMLFMPLVQLDGEMNFQPFLADSFWLAEDGLSITFRIREGAAWHDGTPVTADDVVWTYEMMANEEVAYANRQWIQYIESAERIDDRTVRFDFTQVHSDPLFDFVDWEPMPKHLLGDVAPAELRNAPFNRNPVGNGPFRFVSWSANQEAVFEANEDFVLGRPHLDRIVFRVIPEQTTQLTEVLTGGVDFMRAVPPAEMGRVEESQQIETTVYPARSYTYLAWNSRNPLFEDVNVRRALTMAIDRQQIVDALLYGYGTIATADVMPFQWEFDDDLEPWPYDPERAKEVLAEAGWEDHDGDGVIDKDGRPFRFILETNQGNDLREDAIVIVQSNLEKVGIDVQPRLTEWTSLIDRLKRKDFEAVVSGWSVDFKFDPSETMSCAAIEAKYNYTSFCNPRADSLMQRALTTLDRETAKPLWDEYQRIIHEEQPYSFLYYLEERIAVNRRLRGVEADARGHLVSVAEWWVPEQEQFRAAPVATRGDR